MSLIVEDGTVVPGAESYCSVADADTYHSKRQNVAWAALTTPTKEACLIKGTEYMLQAYRARWKGRRFSIAQTLDWPRVGVVIEEFAGEAAHSYGLFQVPYTVVPLEVKNACAELALRASINTLSEDLTQKVVQETIGPITVKYDQYASAATQYRAIDAMLQTYLQAGGSRVMMKLGRC